VRTFKNDSAQGEISFRRAAALPSAGLTPVDQINGNIVVGHSETGHHHVMVLDRKRSKTPAVEMFSTDNPLVAWIKVNRPTALDHLRPHDTHESIMFGVGVYEVRRKREYTFEGFRQVQD
jgi:hypothetical protein